MMKLGDKLVRIPAVDTVSADAPWEEPANQIFVVVGAQDHVICVWFGEDEVRGETPALPVTRGSLHLSPVRRPEAHETPVQTCLITSVS